jgi:hypothetical protein
MEKAKGHGVKPKLSVNEFKRLRLALFVRCMKTTPIAYAQISAWARMK